MNFKSTLLGLLLFIGISNVITAQCIRTSELMRSPVYNVEGTATLEQFEDGRVEFRLSDDFRATRGPDLQIFLSNDPREIDDAFFVAALAEIRHFEGAISFELPQGFDVNEFQYIVFLDFTFNVFWGNGSLSMPCELDSTEQPDNGDVVTAIPTMGEWGLIAVSLLLLIFGVLQIKETARLRKTSI